MRRQVAKVSKEEYYRLFYLSLLLRSLNAITNETAITAIILRWASPDPGLGTSIELRRGDTGGLRDLLGIGKALRSRTHRGGRAATSPLAG